MYVIHILRAILNMFSTVGQAYGIVWKALDKKTGSIVAVKKIFGKVFLANLFITLDSQSNCTVLLVQQYFIIDWILGPSVTLSVPLDAFRNQTDAQRTFREIMFLQHFGDHPNIIRLLDVHRADNDKDIYLVFEYMGK